MTTAPSTPRLNVALERRPGSRVELRVEVPAAEVDAAIDAALRRLGSRVRVPGFRPGKVPPAIVERAVGWQGVRQDAAEHLLPDVFRRVVEENQLDTVDEPDVQVESVERHQPLVFTATVTVTPTVELGDYLSLRVEEPHTEIGDPEVDEALEEVRREHSELVDVERPAQAGDVIRCALSMRREDQVLSGSDGEERDIELERDKLIPGLVDGILGMNAGESRSFWVKLPEDFPQEDLRGVDVTAEVAISAVRERRLPPLDDALAERDGHGPTLTELREHHRERLVEAARRHDEEVFRAGALEGFRDTVTLDLPPVMVDRELDRQIAELQLRLRSLGMEMERYLEYTQSSVEQLRGERRAEAQLRVKLEVALDALAAAEGIELDEAQVQREEERISEGRRLTPEQRRRVGIAARTDLRRRASAERVLEIARGEV